MRLYTASFRAIAVTAIQDILEIVAPADAVVEIHELSIGQTSDVKDAEEEILAVELTFGHTTSGSGGAAITARAHELGDSAFGGTVERNNTTQATAGSPLTRDVLDFNIRVGLEKIWTPETRHIISPSARFVVELPVAPADSLTLDGSITFAEIGG